MFCGACLRDNALVRALRQMGHAVVMAPMYLPLTLDEDDQSAGTPILFGGINVFLEQQSALFRKAPGWLHRLLAAPSLLRLAAGAAGKTRAEDLGELTISMLRGEEGNQARELDDVIRWLRLEKPDVVCISNSLLVGDLFSARRGLVSGRAARTAPRHGLAGGRRTSRRGGLVHFAQPLFCAIDG
jgi:hypothetical protein